MAAARGLLSPRMLALHAVVFAAAFLGWSASIHIPERVKPPQIVQARILALQPKAPVVRGEGSRHHDFRRFKQRLAGRVPDDPAFEQQLAGLQPADLYLLAEEGGIPAETLASWIASVGRALKNASAFSSASCASSCRGFGPGWR